MPKKSNPRIKWRNSDIARLKQAVNEYNKNVKAVEKLTNGATEILVPQHETLTKTTKRILSRDDYNRELKRLQTLNPKKVKFVETESGVILTDYQLKNAKKDIARINRAEQKKKETVGKLPYTVGGQSTGTTVSEQIADKHKDMNPVLTGKIEKIKTPKELSKALQNWQSRAGDSYGARQIRQLRENYLRALKTSGRINSAAGRKIRDLIKNISDEGLRNGIYTEALTDITDTVYGSFNDTDEFNAQTERILEAWQQFV